VLSSPGLRALNHALSAEGLRIDAFCQNCRQIGSISLKGWNQKRRDTSDEGKSGWHSVAHISVPRFDDEVRPVGDGASE
jgi:hypothetical protein